MVIHEKIKRGAIVDIKWGWSLVKEFRTFWWAYLGELRDKMEKRKDKMKLGKNYNSKTTRLGNRKELGSKKLFIFVINFWVAYFKLGLGMIYLLT